MTEIPDESIDLIITSPPYWNAIDYDVHVSDSKKWYRTRKGEEYDTYLSWLKKCFTECYKKLKPGRFCCVVIGTVLYKGKHYPLPQHFIKLMEEIGYEFYQDIIWNKVTGGVKRAGVTIQNPYPGYYTPNIMTEYILIFNKPGPKIYSNKTNDEKKQNQIPIDDLFKHELANNIWHIAPVPPNQYDHPCPFPEEIPYRLIKLFSYTGEKVLDPFVGIGTTTKVAKNLNRDYYGYDIKEKYVEIAKRRLNEPLKLREQIICKFDKYQPQLELFNEEIKDVLKLSEQTINYGVTKEKINPQVIKKNFKWLFEKNKYMIIHPDLDGYLTSLFLVDHLDWKISGFYNNQEIYLSTDLYDKKPEDFVFVDVDIFSPKIKSIGHHILQWELNFPPLNKFTSNLNPNLLRGITYKNFKHKYPFATIHFIIVLFNALGYKINLKQHNLLIPILLHVDSTLQNSVNYYENSLKWIEYFGGSDKDSPLYFICKILSGDSFRKVFLDMNELYQNIEKINFTYASQCEIENPISENQKIKMVYSLLGEITGWNFPILPKNYKIIKGERVNIKPVKKEFQKIVNNKEVFSYAFFSKAFRGLNYTILKFDDGT